MPRGRPAPIVIIAIALGMLAVYVAIWARIPDVWRSRSDFSATYVAATVWQEGHGNLLYDEDFEARRHREFLPSGYMVDLPYNNPPSAVVIAAPLTTLNINVAVMVWGLIQLALLMLSAFVAMRWARWPARSSALARIAVFLAACAGSGTYLLLLLGQWDGVIALGVASAYAAWRSRRPGLAGFLVVTSLAIAKPHLGLGIAAFLIGRHERRAIMGASIAVVVVGAIGLLVDGVAGYVMWFHELWAAVSSTPANETFGIAGAVASWMGLGSAAQIVVVAGSVVILCVAAVLGWLSRRRPDMLEVAFAGALACSLLVAIHLLGHDLVILAPAFVWCVARVFSCDDSRENRVGLIVGMYGLGWLALSWTIMWDTGNDSPRRMTPLLLFVVVILAVRTTLKSVSEKEVVLSTSH